MSFLKKLFGSRNERYIKKLQPVVSRINELEARFQPMSDTDLRAMTGRFRERLEKGETLDDLLPEAFAVTREAAVRTLGMRHFDVQLVGGIVLHQGKIAEMKTGEGKTLVATLPIYLNALAGRGAHVVTVNDYLARRDAEWMGQIYRFLGMDVGVIVHGISDEERKAAYRADITYGQNNEFGFDYLRDNMKYRIEAYAQRELHYAIVDEVDSILIDEARTPLIISGPTEDSTEMYYKINSVIPRLKNEDHYVIDEKARTAQLTDDGVETVEELIGVDNLYDAQNIEIIHHVNQALRAHTLYQRDTDYVVKDGEVIIVDEFTGRLMPGRRWSDGLHQAVEAKEGVTIEKENQTLASITFQNYFRLYDKLAGMTGTADTEAPEFAQIYELEVMVVPTHKPLIREDEPDLVFKTIEERDAAVLEDIKDSHERAQPVLVGTTSIEKSEVLSRKLKKLGIRHDVLNAKNNQGEAGIIAQAGAPGAVTISTSMAGRGTDIMLGGNPEALALARCEDPDDEAEFQRELMGAKAECEQEKKKVLEAGGLRVVGTERHDSRRIDNQLRGRSGRQGDPGSSRFYLSLEDDLLRIFGGERIRGMMERLGLEEGEAIEHRWLNKAIENAQRKVEGHNFDIRKHLLEYDDVMNDQRGVIYTQRRATLEKDDVSEEIWVFVEEILESTMLAHCDERGYVEDWDVDGLNDALRVTFNWDKEFTAEEIGDRKFDEFFTMVAENLRAHYEARTEDIGTDTMRQLEKWRWLVNMDQAWKDHLLALDRLKEGIGLRGYAQVDPKQIYKKEAFELFIETVHTIKQNTVRDLFHVRLRRESEIEEERAKRAEAVKRLSATHGGDEAPKEAPKRKPVRRTQEKIGRNDPCWCGSGKKYKQCHGRPGAQDAPSADAK